MLTLVNAATGLVVTLNVALVASGGNRDGRRDGDRGVIPREGDLRAASRARPSSVTVPVTGVPPVTLAWLRLTADTPGGTTVSDAVCVAPP